MRKGRLIKGGGGKRGAFSSSSSLSLFSHVRGYQPIFFIATHFKSLPLQHVLLWWKSGSFPTFFFFQGSTLKYFATHFWVATRRLRTPCLCRSVFLATWKERKEGRRQRRQAGLSPTRFLRKRKDNRGRRRGERYSRTPICVQGSTGDHAEESVDR